jgi:hypothetical protein
MKTTIFFTMTLIALLLTACAGERGSSHLITESREVSDFDRVEFALFGELTLTQGETESLTIEAEDNVMAKIQSEVKNGTLLIGLDTGLSDSIEPTKPIKFDLTVKELVGLSLSGSGNINSANLNTEEMDFTVSGSGRIEVANLAAEDVQLELSGSAQLAIGTLRAEKLEADLGGSSEVELAGQVSEQKITVSGSVEYRAVELEIQNVQVELNGGGQVTVWASQTLDVEISGSGQVNYVGTPTVTEDISGSGSITPLNQ